MCKCVISIFLTLQKGNKQESWPGDLRMLTPAALECALCGGFQRQLLQFSDLMVEGTFDCYAPTQVSLQTLRPE